MDMNMKKINVLKPKFRTKEILSEIDRKIEINKKINSELEATAKLIYDYWFVQFDFPDKNGKPYCLGWPRNYKYCHALRSKLKYFAPDVRGETVLDERNVNLNPDKLPYMFSTQNMLGTKALVGTDKLIMKYIDNMVELPTHGNSGEFLGMQCFIRIPLQEAWKFGAWEEGE